MITNDTTYIGDGVFASLEQTGIWLRTKRTPRDITDPEGVTHEICLEPDVFANLLTYAHKIGWLGRIYEVNPQ